jgi:hypothetical protein
LPPPVKASVAPPKTADKFFSVPTSAAIVDKEWPSTLTSAFLAQLLAGKKVGENQHSKQKRGPPEPPPAPSLTSNPSNTATAAPPTRADALATLLESLNIRRETLQLLLDKEKDV